MDSCAFRDKNVRQMLNAHQVGWVEVKKRGVELDTGHWQRRLSRTDGDPACLFVLQLGRRTVALLAHRMAAAVPAENATDADNSGGTDNTDVSNLQLAPESSAHPDAVNLHATTAAIVRQLRRNKIDDHD